MDATTKHILVPVDYSDKAVIGLQMASNLLAIHGGKLTVLNVLKGVDPIFSDTFNESERKELIDKLKKHLRTFAEKYIDSSKFDLHCRVESGKLCETILSTAEEHNVSLIVMGTSTVDNIKKWIIGTNALRIVSESLCPVITLKQEPKSKEIKRIILPMDITKESREKVARAVQLAKENDAEIFVVSAYSLSDESIIGKLEVQQKQVADYIKSHNVQVTSNLLKLSDKVEGILNYVDQNEGDLILITTHQQPDILSSILGSYAKSIIKEAKVPVMSIVPQLIHNVSFRLPAT